jgi:hypothetical protein
MKKAKLPEGYSENRIAMIAAHYDSQTEEDALAEDQTAWGDSSLTWVQVPEQVLPAVMDLVGSVKKPGKSLRAGRVAEGSSEYGQPKRKRSACR